MLWIHTTRVAFGLLVLNRTVVASYVDSQQKPWSSSSFLDFMLLSKPELAKHRVLEFGDYAEVPEDCPATTTCPVLCVADVTECPTACAEGLTLCVTGNCETDCNFWNNGNLENPCACDALPTACPKTVDVYPVCFDRFQTFYTKNALCLEAQADSTSQLSFTGPWFLACYYGISSVTVLVMLWCFGNQKVFPVATSTMPLQASNSGVWTQTGYRTHMVGSLVYAVVNFTFVAIQFLLFTLTIFYYMQQEAITRWAPVFYDEVQVLKAFEIVWMVGLCWCLAFRYPNSVRDLFLRRCELGQATHVAVVAPIQSLDIYNTHVHNTDVPEIWKRMATIVWTPLDCVLRAVFSYPYGRPGLETVFCPIETDPVTGTRSILHRMRRYVYEEASGKGVFVPCSFSVGKTLGDLLDQVGGLSLDEVTKRRGRQGLNVISMPQPTVLGSIYKEFSKTFYVYQNFMVWSWGPFWYYYMAIVNSFVRVTGGLVVAVFQYSSDSVLYRLSHVEGDVQVLRDGHYVEIPVREVVPGDVVVLKPGVNYCDMVVLKADRILLDESALTGEATPVLKVEIDPAVRGATYSQTHHKSYTISAGTEILEVGEEGTGLGLVMTTGSFTAKGELLTEVLSYERHKFKFDDDVKLVVCILVLEAIFLLSLCFYFLNDQWVYAWFYGVYVVGAVIPPLLPTVFVVSVGISAKRLQNKRITCTYPEGILVAGKVDAAFFDKTGTLTKQGMDFISVTGSDSGDKSVNERIRIGMAVCHTLTTMSSGELVGNQVDKVSFESTGAVLEHEKGQPARISFLGKQYRVLKQYEFDCHRQSQSVVVEDGYGTKQIFVKGSPEVIKTLCNPLSLPDSFDKSVRESAKSGVYQIAIAFRSFDLDDKKMSDVSRDYVEKSLTFGGFVNFLNVMREETPGVIQELEEGDIVSAMITGDNVLTGICIAREAGMIRRNRTVILGRKTSDSELEWVDVDRDVVVKEPSSVLLNSSKCEVDLAMTGEAWRMTLENDPKYATLISKHVRVFGRCTPSDKVSVVATFVANGYKTLMCGDGQNDCGSLKAAHVGVALSSAEASIVAPFTSLDKTITSVTEVLREGRCALASALATYSYYIIYGQTESFLQTINAYFAITFTEWCWVFLDGIWSITMAFSLPLSRAAKRLTPRRPTDSLLGPETMFSVCGILAWNFLYLVIALLALFRQDWFQCRKWSSNDVSNVLTIGDNYETTVIFVVGGYQYISTAIVLNFGYTFRQNWFRNYIFVVLALTWTLFVFVMTIYPSNFSCIWRVNCDNEDAVRWVTTAYPVAINNPFNTTVMPVGFRWTLVAIMAANLITIMAWQYFFVNCYLMSRMEGAKKSLSNENVEEVVPLTKGNVEEAVPLTNGNVEEV